MKYNVKEARSRWGPMAKDYELGIDFHRLRQERFQRAQAAVKAAGLGAVLCFDMDNIRYITSTNIGEAFRDFLDHYCICAREGKPYLFDPAVPAADKTAIVENGAARAALLEQFNGVLAGYPLTADVDTVESVDGDTVTATVQVTGPHGGAPMPMTFEREDGTWHLADESTCQVLAMGSLTCR